MLRNSLQWRETNDIDSVLDTWDPPEVMKKYYPGGMYGVDKEGSPIWIETLGYADVKGLLYSAKKSDIIKYKISHCELNERTFQIQTKKLGKRIDGLVIIFDLKKYGLKHLWKPAVDTYNEVLAIFEANYPENLKRTYVVNTPRIFPIAYNLVKHFLSEDTKTKIHILGSNWKERLLKDIDADQLPVNWGGTATDPDGDPFCKSKICMGGEVPKDYYLQKENMFDMSTFTTVTVGSGTFIEKEVEVLDPGCILRWQFCTENSDISFGVYIYSGKDQQEVMSPVRVNCHLVPEDGSYTCSKAGTYVIKFDNTFSWLKSKKLAYLIEVLKPDDANDLHKSASFALNQSNTE